MLDPEVNGKEFYSSYFAKQLCLTAGSDIPGSNPAVAVSVLITDKYRV